MIQILIGKIKEKDDSFEKLKVIKAKREDVGKGFVRIDPRIMEENSFKVGDVIEIINPILNKKTAGILKKGLLEDRNTKSISLCPALRRNIGIEINNFVSISKIQVSYAEKVIFEIINENILLKNLGILAEKLKTRILTKDDVLSFNSTKGRIDLLVLNFIPKAQAVRINHNTRINLSNKN